MFIETAVALVLLFAILVMFHELGHFTAARLVGIRVDEFAFGFGPKLITLFKRGATEYTIHPFPLGGFVKLAGMEPGEEDISDGFQAQAIWKRALVIFAGPFASFVLAVLVFVTMGMFWGFSTGTTDNRVAMVTPLSVAAKAGIRTGDRIISIDGKTVKNGKDMTKLIHNSPGKKLSLMIARNGEKFTKTAVPRWTIIYMNAVWSFPDGKRGVVEEIADKSSAQKAGLQEKDKIVSINGKKINSGTDFAAAIKQIGDRQVKLEIDRGGKTITLTAKPTPKTEKFMAIGLLGFMPEQTLKKAGFIESATKGLILTKDVVVEIVVSLGSKKIAENIGGPLMIAKITQSSVALGTYSIFRLLGLLSMSLAVINLVPIPVVDGGHLVILAIEAVRRKRLTREQMQTVTMVGIFILGAIFVTVIWSDLFKISQGLVPQ
ncbi:RIP metalloprotease RseP [bacterium]|nr:RIP metalloprotease RseP [bacterium]